MSVSDVTPIKSDSDFLQKYNIPVSAEEYAIVFNAIPSGVSFSVARYYFPWPCTYSLNLTDTMIGSVALLQINNNNNTNCKIRAGFQRDDNNSLRNTTLE